MGMAIEEMAELIQQIRKADRKGLLNVQENLVEEFVDVEIMMEQMEVMLDDHLHSFPPMRKNFREAKLNKIRDMLAKGELDRDNIEGNVERIQ